jgi:hypothetical protein
VAASWNWDQRVRPIPTDHDQEALNNGEGLHMKSLLELHYTATDTEIGCEYEFAISALLTRKTK